MVATLKGNDAEAIEFNVGESSAIAGQTLEDAEFPHGCIVGTIIRDGEIIMPRGPDRIEPGDEVIVFALPEAIGSVEKLFE
jgi:trk system potassium uptake protein TrkA